MLLPVVVIRLLSILFKFPLQPMFTSKVCPNVHLSLYVIIWCKFNWLSCNLETSSEVAAWLKVFLTGPQITWLCQASFGQNQICFSCQLLDWFLSRLLQGSHMVFFACFLDCFCGRIPGLLISVSESAHTERASVFSLWFYFRQYIRIWYTPCLSFEVQWIWWFHFMWLIWFLYYLSTSKLVLGLRFLMYQSWAVGHIVRRESMLTEGSWFSFSRSGLVPWRRWLQSKPTSWSSSFTHASLPSTMSRASPEGYVDMANS